MLLRFRGEDAEEITGMVQAVRDHARLGWSEAEVDLDWPSYGAGRTRGAPWFLLSALALARSGVTVLMHGSNDFSSGIAVETAMQAALTGHLVISSLHTNDTLATIFSTMSGPEFSGFYNSSEHDCDSSCYACLRSYANMVLHNLLDWRLGLDLANLMRTGSLAVDKSWLVKTAASFQARFTASPIPVFMPWPPAGL